MTELAGDLVPLIIASAVLPLQTVLALVLARSSLRAAYAWVAGMLVVRFAQGIVFGFILAPTETRAGSGPRYVLGAVLLVLSLALYTKALRAMMGADDEDAPPPKWVTGASKLSPLAAFGAGAGFMTISIKLLVFTLGAISAIEEAPVRFPLSWLMFVVFVVLAQSAPLTIVALASSSSRRATGLLDGFSAWLKQKSRLLNIVFGVVFGTWFLLKALSRLHIL